MSNHIWCFLKKKKNFTGKNLEEIFFSNFCFGSEHVRYVKPNLVLVHFQGVPKIKVAQNVLKHALILEFLSSDEFVFLRGRGWEFPKIKVAQNVLKHALVLEFLRSNEFFLSEKV